MARYDGDGGASGARDKRLLLRRGRVVGTASVIFAIVNLLNLRLVVIDFLNLAMEVEVEVGMR